MTEITQSVTAAAQAARDLAAQAAEKGAALTAAADTMSVAAEHIGRQAARIRELEQRLAAMEQDCAEYGRLRTAAEDALAEANARLVETEEAATRRANDQAERYHKLKAEYDDRTREYEHAVSALAAARQLLGPAVRTLVLEAFPLTVRRSWFFGKSRLVVDDAEAVATHLVRLRNRLKELGREWAGDPAKAG